MPLGAYLRMLRFPFQFSIGDAAEVLDEVEPRRGVGFNSLLEMRHQGASPRQRPAPFVSILYWRCKTAQGVSAAAQRGEFQFSIGDARISTP